jgi:hypothetical protein
LFALGSLLKMIKVAQIIWLLCSAVQVCIKFDKKMGLASCWAIFSKAYLEPILRLLNSQLQRQACRRLERF